MNRRLITSTVLAIVVCSTVIVAAQSTIPQRPTRPDGPGWKLVWSDEFNGADGTSPDATKWTYDLGAGVFGGTPGWGNSELESYTNRTVNVQQKGGNLVITAQKETYSDPSDNYSRQYTSARIKSQGLYDVKYGRIEARIKIPAGQGIWPAFWMLGNDIDTNGWPNCGEIDIMENIGKQPAIDYGTIHGPGSFSIGSSYTLPSGNLSDDFHIYAIEWDANQIRFYFDNVQYATRTPSELPSGDSWPFNHNFFIILNVAVGGSWPGNPDSTTVFPQQMLVDYVRVYTMR